MTTPGLNNAAFALVLELSLFALFILTILIDFVFLLFYDITKFTVFILLSRLFFARWDLYLDIKLVQYSFIFTLLLMCLEVMCESFSYHRIIEGCIMALITLHETRRK